MPGYINHYIFLVRYLNFGHRLKPGIMKISLISSLLLLSFVLSGCGAIETIFKAGMWWAFILVALVVGIILYVMAKVRKK